MADRDASERGRPDVRIMLRPLGSALPMGFFAFGTGMAVLAPSTSR